MQWRKLIDSEPPKYNRRFLESRLAYRIQELAYGGLKPATVERLEANLLATLENARLVIPLLRIRFPDEVARRIWLDRHEGKTLIHPAEPDGDRWNAAVELLNKMYRWQNSRAYGPSPHPLDEPVPNIQSFLQDPSSVDFEPWNDMRVDVSNDEDELLFDSGNVQTFYSSWQLLLAIEAADAGILFRVNLADKAIAEKTIKALHSEQAPDAPYTVRLLPSYAARDRVLTYS